MVIRRLGPEGAEITLPSVAISLPVTVRKNIEKAVMSSGSIRWNFKKDQKAWEITFPKITKSQLDDLKTLDSYKQILRWQNPDESETWYDVVITDFHYDSEDPNSPTSYWFAHMTLEEAN